MPSPEEIADLLALTLVPGLGPRITQSLLDHFGSATAARYATVAQLEEVPNIGFKLARSFNEALRKVDPSKELELAARLGVNLLPITSSDYPASLKNIGDTPPILYVRGFLSPADSNTVAIVGSRKCTPYGQKAAHRLAGGLVRAGYTVVSGLALGIDGWAHVGALEASGRTIAVLAGGLSAIYPPEHVDLANRVALSGALITETPLSMAPQRGMFHARNRLISGLSLATVIIEANDRSGALITARHAAEQGREVFALPANADSVHSAGTLQLLRDGARMIRGIDDLLEDLQGLRAPETKTITVPTELMPVMATPVPESPPVPQLDPVQQRVWEFLTEPRHSDELLRTLGLASGELNRILLTLEMKKLIRRAQGGMFERR
jgi:DNA processing protein